MSKGAVFVSLMAFSLLPIWRSGLREKMSLLEFIIGHTIWSPYDVLYVPEEYLTRGISKMEVRNVWRNT